MKHLVENNFLALREELEALVAAEDRLEFFVEQAKSVPALAQDLRSESFRVRGCISNLWIVPSCTGGKCSFICDGDAIIPKGVAITILEIFQDAEPQEILSFDRSRLGALGIAEVLTPNRRNALAHVFDVVFQFALACSQSDDLQVVHG